MGELAKKQVRFTHAFTRLLNHALLKGEQDGFNVVIEEVYRHQNAHYGHPESCHKFKLAGHLLIFTRDYDWPHPNQNNIYNDLHMFWEFLGGAPMIEGDENHFSFEHNGVI